MYILIIAILITLYYLSKEKGKRKDIDKSNRNEIQEEWKSEWKWDEEKKLWIHPNSRETNSEYAENKYKEVTEEINYYRNAYVAQRLLTKNELFNYKKLKNIADTKGYIICPKVRLLDIITPKKEDKKYKTLFWKIQAKHVDFVICDQDMNIKLIIELDDKTHNRPDRKERDLFVDTILKSVGYRVIHTRNIEYNILDSI